MTKLTAWIKHHQLAAVFILTFSITWGLGFTYGRVLLQGQFLLIPLAAVATCGPALAGIVISAITNTKAKQGSKRVFWRAFFTAWFVSAVVFLTHNVLFNNNQLSLGVSVVSVIPVAFILSMAYSRMPAVKSYIS